MSETKPESTAEPRDRKSPRAEEKAATPVKPTEAIERKSAKQLGPDKRESQRQFRRRSLKARTEIKSGTKTVAETKESREEKKAKKEELDSKGKSTRLKKRRSR